MVIINLYIIINNCCKLVFFLNKGTGDWSSRTIRLPQTTDLSKTQLWDLLDQTSVCAIRNLGFDPDKISATDPEDWCSDPELQSYSAVVISLKVVNDVAERSVALTNFCNGAKRTRDEAEFQNFVQVTENNRKRICNVKKSTLQTYEMM